MVEITRKTKRKLKFLVPVLLVACIAGGAVIAQLYLSLQHTADWELATNQLEFTSTYWFGGSDVPCADFAYCAGVISGSDNQIFSCTLKWYPSQEVEYELVAIHRIDGGSATVSIDLVWDGDDLVDTTGFLKGEIWGYFDEFKGSTFARIAYWDSSTGVFTVDNDMNFGADGVAMKAYLVIVIVFHWDTAPTQPFTWTCSSEAG